MIIGTDSPSARRSKWCVAAQLIICVPRNIDFTTCSDFLMQRDFHAGAVGATLHPPLPHKSAKVQEAVQVVPNDPQASLTSGCKAD